MIEVNRNSRWSKLYFMNHKTRKEINTADFMGREPCHNLCAYVRRAIWEILWRILVGMMSFSAGLFIGWVVMVYPLKVAHVLIVGLMCVVTGGGVVVWILVWRKAADSEPVTIVHLWVKAQKDRICPLISFVSRH